MNKIIIPTGYMGSGSSAITDLVAEFNGKCTTLDMAHYAYRIGEYYNWAYGIIECNSIGEATFKYGSFLNAVINFLIIALVVFFLIKLVNKITPKKEVEEDPAPTNEEIYLRQIRDLLQEKNK